MVKNIVAGALFDFLGYLTTREEPITLSAKHTPYDVIEALQEWADSRGLDIAGADVQNWHEEIG